jgi:hypothetical protein
MPDEEITPAQALLALMDNITPLRETVNGYRAQLLADGYSAGAAESMAVDLHRHLLMSAFAAVEK